VITFYDEERSSFTSLPKDKKRSPFTNSRKNDAQTEQIQCDRCFRRVRYSTRLFIGQYVIFMALRCANTFYKILLNAIADL
jgi:hypothetical protein